VRRSLARAALAAGCACLLTGCIDSAAPILTDSKRLLGQRLDLRLFTVRDGKISDEGEGAIFVWNGQAYANIIKSLGDVAYFSVHPFDDGTFIVQTYPLDRKRGSEYALMRQIPFIGDAYSIAAIDEEDADAGLRKVNCEATANYACRITTREQLYALARATAAKPHDHGMLAVHFVRDAKR
jgi:hypothetical protein